MRRIGTLLAAMAIVVSMFASAAVAAIVVDGVNRVGTNGPNRLVGTPESDRLVGLGGNDTLIGAADADILSGGDGNDVISARERGEQDGDQINCGRGRDTVLTDRSTEDIIAANCEIIRQG